MKIIRKIIDEVIDIFFWLKNRKEIQKQMASDEHEFNNTVIALNRAKKKIVELETEISILLSEMKN